MRRDVFMKRLEKASRKVRQEIRAQAESDGLFGAGLANEGYQGGYLDALMDVDAMLSHGYPSDSRDYWDSRK